MKTWLPIFSLLVLFISCNTSQNTTNTENSTPSENSTFSENRTPSENNISKDSNRLCIEKDCEINSTCTNCQSASDLPTNYCEHPDEKVPFNCHQLLYSTEKSFCDIRQIRNLSNVMTNICKGTSRSLISKSDCILILSDLKQATDRINQRSCNNADIVLTLLNIQLFKIIMSSSKNLEKQELIKNSNNKYQYVKSNAELKECDCKEALSLYNNPVIQMEGQIVQAVNESEMEGEGSLNYIIEPDEDFPMKFARNSETIDFFDELYLNSGSFDQEAPVVAFLDSGVEPQLFRQDQYLGRSNTCGFENDHKGWNFIEDNNITHDALGHGTLVAASFQDILLMNAPSKEYKVLPVKILDDCGYGTIYSAVCGLYYASRKGADIINCSWGLYKDDNVLRNAISEISRNSLIVASAGNKGHELNDINIEHYPSEYSASNTGKGFNNVIEVAGLCQTYRGRRSQSYTFWEESNTNITNIAESSIGYDVLIDSLVENGLGVNSQDCTVNGTSYAAPRITAALVNEWLDNPAITRSSFENNLNALNNCKDQKSYWSGQ